VTFNLKDFKAVLAYCLSTRNNLGILFSRAGEPLAILPMPMHEHMNSEFTSEFVLATMLDSTVDSNTGKPSPMIFQPAPANTTNGSRGEGASTHKNLHQHSTLARELEKRNKQQQQRRPIRDAMTPQGSDMDTNEVAKHLVAMNHMSDGSHPQPMSTSTTTGSVGALGGGGAEGAAPMQQQEKPPPNMRQREEQRKRLRASQDTDTLVSGSTLSLRYSAVEEADVQRKEDLNSQHKHKQDSDSDSDSDSDEVPGTPTHERRVDTWVENWS
jgi:hypothetical protein